MNDRVEKLPPSNWDLPLAYRMVRERHHAVTDRQRKLQGELNELSKQLTQHYDQIVKLSHAITIVENAGGDAGSLRTQIAGVRAKVQRIQPRHAYLEQIEALLAANLRLLHQAHDALHWLNFENNTLADFDKQPEVLIEPLASA